MTLRAPRRIAALVAAPALLASGVAFAAPGADAAATSEPTYKGSSMALSVKVGLAGSSILDEVLPELVTYPPGATKSLLELPQELAEVVTLKVLNASSEVSNGVLKSNANTANLAVLGDVVGARVLNADCLAEGDAVSGDSQVAGLTIAGTKVPVDPGPNFKIEIPAALGALVTGSIVVDEQTETADGGIQVRALHINLVVAPTAIEEALNSVIRTVRETAQQLKVVVEEVTGKSLDELVGAAEKTAKQQRAAAKKGAQSADKAEVRASAAAPQAPAAEQAPAAAEAPAEAAAPAAGTQKSDGADVDSEAGAAEETDAEAAESAESTEAAEEAEEAAAPESAEAEEAAQEAEDAEAAARAERAEKGAKTAEEIAVTEPTATENTDPALATVPAPAAPAEAPPAETPATTAAKSTGAVIDKVQKAIPTADSIAGALGVDIIVSQVTCDGEPGEEVARVNQLPKTGGNGNATRDVAVGGLGLLLVGGTALALTRRRRATV